MASRLDIKKIPIRYFILFAIATALTIFGFIAIQFLSNFYETKRILEVYNSIFNIKTEINYIDNTVHTIFSSPYRYIDETDFSRLYKSIENINHYINTISNNKIIKNNPYYHQVIADVNNYKVNLQKIQSINYKLFNPTEGKISILDNLIFQIKSNSKFTTPPFDTYTAEIINTINNLESHNLPNEIISKKLNELEKQISRLPVKASQLQTKNNLVILLGKIKNNVAQYLLLLDQYGKPFASGVLKKLDTGPLTNSTSQLLENIDNNIVKRKFYYRSILLTVLTLLFALIIISLGVNLYFLLSRNLNKIINYLTDLEQGNLERKNLIKTTKEFGLITLAINRISSNLKYKSKIIYNFSQGQYNQEIHALSPADEIAHNLIKLQEYLHNYEQNIEQTRLSEAKQKWVTQGLALLGDVLREHASNLDNLLDNSLKTLLDYLKAPMGAIYYVNYEYEDPVYELKIAYAYDKKKIHKVKYRLTEGFVGTVAADGEPIILHEVPQDYIFYETAFGYGRPKTIAWFPVKEEKNIYAVIELALHENFDQHHLQLIEKFTSDLASTITFVNVNLQTQHLVKQLTEKTEQFEQQEIQYKLTIEDLNDKVKELEQQIKNLKLDLSVKQDIISEKVAKIVELEEKLKEKETELNKTIERFKKAEELYKTKIANLQEQIQKLSDQNDTQQEE